MDEIQALVGAGVLLPLDVHFARALARWCPVADPGLRLGAALVSRLSQSGHVCADLPRWAGTPFVGSEGETLPEGRWPALDPWLATLRGAAAVGVPSDPIPGVTPLVLDAGGRLYLRRLYEDQARLATALLARAAAPIPSLAGPLLREGLDRLFGAGSFLTDHPVHGQRRAALLALLRPFCVITGGPGTGKTTVVASLLSLLAEQALAAGVPPPAVRLLAPTGKAAARLLEALREARERLPIPALVKAALPRDASTIHRALSTLGGLGMRFRHGPDDPLPADVVVVDEASMVDLFLMARLVEALGPATRLVLLGDRQQLASVDAGTVLGDLCGPSSMIAPACSAPVVAAAFALTGDVLPAHPAQRTLGLGDSIAPLSFSFRFGARSGIGRLAAAIGEGDAEAALALLGDAAFPDVTRVEPPSAPRGEERSPSAQEYVRPLLSLMQAGYHDLLAARGPEDRLAALGRFRVLCAHRQGPWGAEALCTAFEALLPGDGRSRAGTYYDGRPLLVTQNHYGLELWNGDVGVICAAPAAKGDGSPAPFARAARGQAAQLRAFFPSAAGPLRSFAPARLPAHEPLYAMSVHKSQGSELDAVLVVLPDLVTRVLSRELLYTAVTRARQRVVIHARAQVLAAAIARRVDRASGLPELMWGSSAAPSGTA